MFLLFRYTLKGYLGQYHTPSWSFPTSSGAILLTSKRCAALAFTHGIARASISASLITLITQPMVGVPRMMGTLVTKLEKSGMNRPI